MNILGIIFYTLLAPFIGGCLAGADRIVTARMQSRYGPPLFQPFYDILKLFSKEHLAVNRYCFYYLVCFVIFLVFGGCLFFVGYDILLMIFAITVAHIFLVMAAFAANSPYAFIGAQRELIQMLAAEPMLILAAVGLYKVTGSFNVGVIATSEVPAILYLPGVFFGLLYILTIKFRKSPFDLATSHHAHQELVKGLTTEFAGPSLALIELAHWYEVVLYLGLVFLFFAFQPVLGVLVCLLVYFLEVLIDNANARFKWQLTIQSTWAVTLVFGVGNLFILQLLLHR